MCIIKPRIVRISGTSPLTASVCAARPVSGQKDTRRYGPPPAPIRLPAPPGQPLVCSDSGDRINDLLFASAINYADPHPGIISALGPYTNIVVPFAGRASSRWENGKCKQLQCGSLLFSFSLEQETNTTGLILE